MITDIEAEKLCKSIEKIDNGCPYCIDAFLEDINSIFSNFKFYRNKDYDGMGEEVLFQRLGVI